MNTLTVLNNGRQKDHGDPEGAGPQRMRMSGEAGDDSDKRRARPGSRCLYGAITTHCPAGKRWVGCGSVLGKMTVINQAGQDPVVQRMKRADAVRGASSSARKWLGPGNRPLRGRCYWSR